MNKSIIGVCIVAVVVVLIVANSFGIFGSRTGYASNTGPSKSGVDENDVRISLDSITQDAKWYEYDSRGTRVRFFAVKAADGSVKTGFDACDVCWKSGKGYSQDGNYMVCNNCGNRYPISELGTENKRPGGCWPGFLPNMIDGSDVVISIRDLDIGRTMFR